MALAPFDKGIYFLLANAFESKRDFNSAAEILKDGAKILVNDFELNQKAGLLMYKYGKISDALPFLKRALDIDPENHELSRLVELLLNNNSDLGKYIYPVALVEK